MPAPSTWVPIGPATAQAPATFPTQSNRTPLLVRALQGTGGLGGSGTVKPIKSLPHPWTGTQG